MQTSLGRDSYNPAAPRAASLLIFPREQYYAGASGQAVCVCVHTHVHVCMKKRERLRQRVRFEGALQELQKLGSTASPSPL